MNKGFEHDEELWSIREKNNMQMLSIRCVSIPNLFQMKSMKVNCILKSIPNKGFEHDEELWSIWEKNNM
jgi:hypothetical protein